MSRIHVASFVIGNYAVVANKCVFGVLLFNLFASFILVLFMCLI